MNAAPAGLAPGVTAAWQRYYPAYREDAFVEFVAGKVRPEMEVLEIGAGSGTGHQAVFPLKGKCRRYVGVDLDPRVLSNPNLDEARVCDADALPFEAGRFDFVFHKFVAEHLRDPVHTFAETFRVLKPGGSVTFATPSRFYYAMVIAQITPEAFQRWLLMRLWPKRHIEDKFHTYYRLNSERAIRRCAKRLGARVDVQRISTPPGYLRRVLPLFLAGIAYERTMERVFPALRAVIWATMTKPS